MKKLFRILALFIAIITTSSSCFAFPAGKIEKIIEKSNLEGITTIAISVKDASSGKTVYERDSKKLLHPASTLKIPIAYFAINTLGYDYLFKTGFYTHNKDLYIKLGADPFLNTNQLKIAFKALKDKGLNTFENLYIDDSIIDKKESAAGWMWDDDVNPHTPKISAYNLDKNLIKVNISQLSDGTVKATPASKYPMSIFAYIQKNEKSDYYDINRYNWDNPELVEIYANVASTKPLYIPISSMRRYFIYNTENIIEDERITVKSTSYSSKLVPEEAEMVYEITNPIEPSLTGILYDSNNLMSETIYKLAGGHKYGITGTDIAGLSAMTEFYKDYNIDFDNVLIKDGSGVSRKNLVSTDWMSNILLQIYKNKNFDKFKQYLAQPGDGTLSQRLFDLRGDAWLKTGSLSGISTIAGYINSKDGNTYAIAIFTQNFKEKQKDIKKIEDDIINLIYNR